MIIKSLLDLIYSVVSLLTIPIDIPSLPSEVYDYVFQFIFDYLGTGIGLLSNFCHLGYILTLFGLICAVDIGLGIYYLVMWILKKIPMISVS